MAVDIGVKDRHAGYSKAEVTQPPTWHGLVAWDLLFNNGATGLFLVAAIAELAWPTIFGGIARVAYPIALVLLLTDLACLVFDLGSPTKFHHMLRVFKPTSPMSLGTWCLTVYSMPLTVVAAIDMLTYLGWLPRDSRILGWVHWLALIAGLLPALGSAAYKGVLFSTSSQPGWKDARWLGAYLVNSAFLYGMAGLMMIASTLDGHVAKMLAPPLKILAGLNLVLLILMGSGMGEGLRRSFSPVRMLGLRAMAIVLGLLIPMGLISESNSWPIVASALACMLVGAATVRFAIVKIPHAVRGPDHLSSEA